MHRDMPLDYLRRPSVGPGLPKNISRCQKGMSRLLTSHEVLGIAGLGFPILLERHDPHKDGGYEDYDLSANLTRVPVPPDLLTATRHQ
jgi:hypothetical protein